MIFDTNIKLFLYSFFGGLVDSAVGGGGLILLPALFHELPMQNISTILGTNKFAAWSGTISSILKYTTNIKLNLKIIIPVFLFAFIFSFIGATSSTLVPKRAMEYVSFLILILIAIHTFSNKKLGRTNDNSSSIKYSTIKCAVFGSLVGFYDGIFGPGSGSIILFIFVKYFGFSFLNASAAAKIVNLGTFSAALFFFIPSGHILWFTGGVVAAGNIVGSLTGTFLSLRYGSQFIRIFFMTLIVFLVGRMGFTLFLQPA